MIIYNMTVQIENAIANAWLDWIMNEYIPEIVNTNCFTNVRLVKLLEVDESDGPTYAIQCHADSKSDYNRFMELYSDKLRHQSYEKWGDRFIAFNSVMQVVK